MKKNTSILMENILFSMQDEEVEQQFFRALNLGMSALDAEQFALEWRDILTNLRKILPLACSLHCENTEELTTDLVSFIRKRHESSVKRNR